MTDNTPAPDAAQTTKYDSGFKWGRESIEEMEDDPAEMRRIHNQQIGCLELMIDKARTGCDARVVAALMEGRLLVRCSGDEELWASLDDSGMEVTIEEAIAALTGTPDPVAAARAEFERAAIKAFDCDDIQEARELEEEANRLRAVWKDALAAQEGAMTNPTKLQPSYHGLPPAEAVAEHARLHPLCGTKALWFRDACGAPMFYLLWVDGDGRVMFDNRGCDGHADAFPALNTYTWTPCHPNGWPVAAITPDEHAAAVFEGYREGWHDREKAKKHDGFDCWHRSNARAALHAAERGGTTD